MVNVAERGARHGMTRREMASGLAPAADSPYAILSSWSTCVPLPPTLLPLLSVVSHLPPRRTIGVDSSVECPSGPLPHPSLHPALATGNLGHSPAQQLKKPSRVRRPSLAISRAPFWA